MKIKRNEHQIKNHKKRYRLGFFDMYLASTKGSSLELNPLHQFILNTKIDYIRLKNAVSVSLEKNPLLSCRVLYDKELLLEELKGDVAKAIKHCRLEDRPMCFGSKDTTGSFPFQICYNDNWISIEFAHFVTDASGIDHFITNLLQAYFGVPLSTSNYIQNFELPYEKIYDPTIYTKRKQFAYSNSKSHKYLSIKKTKYFNYNVFKIKTSQVLDLSKKYDTTPAPLIATLMCKSLRESVSKEKLKHPLTFAIYVNGRKIINCPTMHNCVFENIQYYDEDMINLDIKTQNKLINKKLRNFMTLDNMSRWATGMYNNFNVLFRLRPELLRKCIYKISSNYCKCKRYDAVITYFGKSHFPKSISKYINYINIFCSPTISSSIVAVSELNDYLYFYFTDFYTNDNYINNFVDLCKKENLEISFLKKTKFKQAKFKHN